MLKVKCMAKTGRMSLGAAEPFTRGAIDLCPSGSGTSLSYKAGHIGYVSVEMG